MTTRTRNAIEAGRAATRADAVRGFAMLALVVGWLVALAVLAL